jgi:hypothetical protein
MPPRSCQGREFIGCEADPEWAEKASTRIIKASLPSAEPRLW